MILRPLVITSFVNITIAYNLCGNHQLVNEVVLPISVTSKAQ